jgi:phosphoribosyl-ATP pyrophosphohydrolase
MIACPSIDSCLLAEVFLYPFFLPPIPMPDKITILLPKATFDPESKSRNAVGDLLKNAGYDSLFRQKLNGKDCIEQGDFRFQGIKGPNALLWQLLRFRNESVGLMMGTDIIAEAQLKSLERLGKRAEIERLLTLGVGQCRMRFLAPAEAPIQESRDLRDRLIFSKYPALTSRLLSAMNVSATVAETDGADTRVNELRDAPWPVAAFEVVESGKTARENGLMIAEQLSLPSGNVLGLSPYSPDAVQTDLFFTNRREISEYARGALRRLGLDLESAMTVHQFISFRFQVPKNRINAFRGLGMRGPSIKDVLSDGESLAALEVFVPVLEKSAMRERLMKLGATDLGSGEVMNVERSTELSEVLRVLPFEEPTEVAVKAADRIASGFTQTLLSLQATVVERAASGKEGATTRALRLGKEFCAAKFTEESLEIAEAVQAGASDALRSEAADWIYRFAVALQSCSAGMPVLGSDLSQTVREPLQLFISACTRFSSAVRKEKVAERLGSAASDALNAFARLLASRQVSLEAVTAELDARHAPKQ